MSRRKKGKTRNPVAKALAHAICRPKVIPNKKAYKRRPRNPSGADFVFG